MWLHLWSNNVTASSHCLKKMTNHPSEPDGKMQSNIGHNAIFNCKSALNIVVCDILPIFLMMKVLSSYLCWNILSYVDTYPESKVHEANMGPTWVLSAPDGPMLAPWSLLSGYLIFWSKLRRHSQGILSLQLIRL